MNSNTPIYFANITVEIIKNKTVLKKIIIPEMIVKGFTFKHIVQNNINNVLTKLAKHYKIADKESARISNIEYLKQLGFGVDF